MEISKICRQERRLAKYYEIKNSKLLVIQSVMDIKVNCHQESTNVLIRRLEIQVFKWEQETRRIKNRPMSYTGLSSSKKFERFRVYSSYRDIILGTDLVES